MRIAAEPTGEFYLDRNGEQMCKFPWPKGIVHYATVPEPYQAGDCPEGFGGGHVPGPCCATRTCHWMDRPLSTGGHSQW